MYCPHCGKPNTESANFCFHCGQPTHQGSGAPPAASGSSSPPRRFEEGRGTMILTFGILSIVAVGLFLGIPAWVMGKKDLEKIQAGIIDISHQATTKTGMILGIIGTFLSGITILIVLGVGLAVGISMFSSEAVKANQDAMLSDLANLSADCYQYKIRSFSMGGGGGSYEGYALGSFGPWGESNPNARYSIEEQTESLLRLKAESKQVPGASIEVSYDGSGRIIDGPNIRGF